MVCSNYPDSLSDEEWRLIAPWKSVYTQFKRWQASEVLMVLEDYLRGELRKKLGRRTTPFMGIVDSQSVKTTEMGRIKGYDGAKKVKGRKRHLLVDSQ